MHSTAFQEDKENDGQRIERSTQCAEINFFTLSVHLLFVASCAFANRFFYTERERIFFMSLTSERPRRRRRDENGELSAAADIRQRVR